MIPTVSTDDRLIGRVINFVGAVLLVCLLIIGALALTARPIPDVLQNVTVGALTGLVGLLVKRTS